MALGSLPAEFNFMSLREQPEESTIYTCVMCRCPLGDSEDCAFHHVGDRIKLLKAVTSQVEVGEEKIVSSDGHDSGSTYQLLHCGGCTAIVGKFYCATPRHLNFKRHFYALNDETLNCYTIGSADEDQLLPTSEVPITLEKYAILNEELIKCRILLGVIEKRISTLEIEESEDSEEAS
ncbi:protein Mis18-alpha-like isoform X1 [Mixophyes fleayi]|uniref:protein Mis18-alpha-like isoform X1 n=1 Tax=Mixophyes fleayi TaxID=3061075 RepID=UPI003F4E1616